MELIKLLKIMKKHKICIIGDGLSGLIAAKTLGKLNIEIDLISQKSKSFFLDNRTTAISPSRNLDENLLETQYMIEMDNRLGMVAEEKTGTLATESFIDDDNMATYYLSRGTDAEYVTQNTDTTDSANQTIQGPRGTILTFKLQASLELNTSDYLFDTIGTTETIAGSKTGASFKTIKSNIRVAGVKTGYRIDIPVKFCKKI